MCLHRKEIPAKTAIGKEIRHMLLANLKENAKERLARVRRMADKNRVLHDGKK